MSAGVVARLQRDPARLAELLEVSARGAFGVAPSAAVAAMVAVQVAGLGQNGCTRPRNQTAPHTAMAALAVRWTGLDHPRRRAKTRTGEASRMIAA